MRKGSLYDQGLPLKTLTMLPLLKSAKLTASLNFHAVHSSHKQSVNMQLLLKGGKYTASPHLVAVQPFIDSNGCRTPTYSSLLLTHAWSNNEWVQGIERQLASFLSAKGSKRHSLPAMPRHQREVVHALAEQYGMASSSYKPEPQRYVELFKLPVSSVPNK